MIILDHYFIYYNNIFKNLEEFYSGKVIRCEVVSLKPHTNIRMHIDGGPLLHYSRRVHIPVITSEEVTFTVMDTTINMKESVWYEINNQMKHGANKKIIKIIICFVNFVECIYSPRFR